MASPILYRPTMGEIVSVTQSAMRLHPAHSSRIERAKVILEVGDVQLEPVAWEVRQIVHWRISSQSHKGAYIVVGLGCPCQDCHTKAPVFGGAHFCKHSIAVALYLKILRNHLNADIRKRTIEIDSHGAAYASRMGIVTVAPHGTGYTFADQASAVRYSMWLAKHTADVDTRVVELEELAQEEGIVLPMPASVVAFFESQGYVVDLQTGEALKSVAVELSPSYQALSHLYGLTAA